MRHSCLASSRQKSRLACRFLPSGMEMYDAQIVTLVWFGFSFSRLLFNLATQGACQVQQYKTKASSSQRHPPAHQPNPPSTKKARTFNGVAPHEQAGSHGGGRGPAERPPRRPPLHPPRPPAPARSPAGGRGSGCARSLPPQPSTSPTATSPAASRLRGPRPRSAAT